MWVFLVEFDKIMPEVTADVHQQHDISILSRRFLANVLLYREDVEPGASPFTTCSHVSIEDRLYRRILLEPFKDRCPKRICERRRDRVLWILIA